jgi:hypothetical protein
MAAKLQKSKILTQINWKRQISKKQNPNKFTQRDTFGRSM